MGRNKVELPNDTYIIFGYDAPLQGYFAEYWDHNKNNNRPVEDIGFFRGVNKNKVLEFLEKYNAIEAARKQRSKAYDSLCLDLPC